MMKSLVHYRSSFPAILRTPSTSSVRLLYQHQLLRRVCVGALSTRTRDVARFFSSLQQKHQHQQQPQNQIQAHKRHEEAMRHLLQHHGHHLANVNPIRPDGLLTDIHSTKQCLPKSAIPLLDTLVDLRRQKLPTEAEAGFSEALKKRLLQNDHISIHDDDATSLQKLVKSYCNCIGYEFEHCVTEEERQFFVSVIENPQKALSEAGLLKLKDGWIYEQLYRTELFEKLLRERYSNARTFGIEGMESAALAINTIVESFANAAPSSSPNMPSRVLVGTSHRGRINYLANCLELPWSTLISSWDETGGPTYDDICDPYSAMLTTTTNKPCHLCFVPIPAHLEAMVPGLLGKSRAHAAEMARTKGLPSTSLATDMVLPLSLHGDSSFCGEGIIQETLQLSTCQHYQCGGTIHMILNNQVGFTTELASIKSDRFQGVQSSDVIKSIGAPILHVNANQPQAVVRACQIAVLYRQQFGKDILIDLVGWRKRGHNELDDPTMTNVDMYQKVNELESVTAAFQRELTTTQQQTELEHIRAKVDDMYHAAKEVKRDASNHQHVHKTMDNDLDNPWQSARKGPTTTSISTEMLQESSAPLITIPDSFTPHPLVEKVVKARQSLLTTGDGRLDWATAELLALSSLATEGIHVRLSGEDSERGTFAQRHAVWHDFKTGKEHIAVPSNLEVANSPLSELGVVGFEYGWSLGNPDSLVLWEAQFGDFSNEAQVIFDTVVSSSAEKWNVESNLVLLLAHGFDGMGPEHSSCRPERWLQLFASESSFNDDDPVAPYKASNFIVACPTEPANYFHLLRRQLVWPFRRPLIILAPKRTLRNSAATSKLADVLVGGRFSEFSCVLDDSALSTSDKTQVEGVLLCSGELYFDMIKMRETTAELKNVAFVRLEQLAPFPSRQLDSVIREYPNIKGVAWAQEEPANDGASLFVRDHIQYKLAVPSLHHVPMEYISRPESAAPAEGHPFKHRDSQEDLFSKIRYWAGSLTTPKT